jgi:hypothetical protein
MTTTHPVDEILPAPRLAALGLGMIPLIAPTSSNGCPMASIR